MAPKRSIKQLSTRRDFPFPFCSPTHTYTHTHTRSDKAHAILVRNLLLKSKTRPDCEIPQQIRVSF